MNSNNFDLPGAAKSAANSGNVIEAIKITRVKTGLGLKEAKDLVDAYVAGTTIEAQDFASTGSSQLPTLVIKAIESGNTIEAIKILQTETGLGLKEAKDVVDSYMAGNPPNKSRSRTIVVEQSSQWGKIVLIALLLAGVVVAVLAMKGSL